MGRGGEWEGEREREREREQGGAEWWGNGRRERRFIPTLPANYRHRCSDQLIRPIASASLPSPALSNNNEKDQDIEKRTRTFKGR